MTRATDFEYVKGPVKTNTPWFRPDPVQLNNWRDEIFKIPGIDKYRVWVYGGCLEEWQTWDTDVVLTGEILDKEELQNILIAMTRLGLEKRQLIDVNWCGYREKHFLKGNCDHQQISCDNFLKTGQCTPESCILPRAGDKGFITISDRVYKNGHLIKAPSSVWEKIGEHLWFRDKAPEVARNNYQSPKMVKRIQEKAYKNKAHLITRRLDFRTLVKWP